MKFFKNTFKEIFRPVSVLKKVFTDRAHAYSKIKNEVVNIDIEKRPPIDPKTSKQEFIRRYQNLYFHHQIILVFFLYSFAYLISQRELFSILASLVICAFFFANYVIIGYRSYLCRVYFSRWNKRQERVKFTVSQYLSLACSDIWLLVPQKDIKKHNKLR